MPKIVVIISADAEWQAILASHGDIALQPSPMGTWFEINVHEGSLRQAVTFFHGGWGKIAAAASAQYVIDRWSPDYLINLGTCGGIQGEIARGTIVLATKTLVHDILEQMYNADEAIKHYTIDMDHSALLLPFEHSRGTMASADKDLSPFDTQMLRTKYKAVAADWESGAIAYVAKQNDVSCIILRIVSDLVGDEGEAYNDAGAFWEASTQAGMERLIQVLPQTIRAIVETV